MKKIIWILIVVAVVFIGWLFIKEPAQAPETEVMKQEITEYAPEEAAGTDETHEATAEDMMPPVSE